MTIEDDIAFLVRVPALRPLGDSALRILAIGAESIDLAVGQVLFTAGEIADGAYLIQRGSCTLNPAKPGNSDIIAGPGTLLGELALLTETRRPATARANEETTVLRIPRSMFLRMLEGYPDAAQRLRGLMVARADQWARELQNVRAVLTPNDMSPQ